MFFILFLVSTFSANFHDPVPRSEMTRDSAGVANSERFSLIPLANFSHSLGFGSRAFNLPFSRHFKLLLQPDSL
jgi:hypothetical protein